MTQRSSNRRASPDLVREQAIKIAKLYYEERLTAAEIIDRLPNKLRPSSTRTVYRRLRQARHFLDVTITPKDNTAPASSISLDADLARTLAAELGVADALVLQSTPDDDDDDVAQSRLGAVAAQYAAGQLGDEDVIGVGSGRGVWHCINALEGEERLQRLKGLRVVSLSGAVARWGQLARLHADANTDQLARTLGLPSSAVRTTDLPLSIRHLSPKQRKGIIEDIAPQLSENPWELDDPPWNRSPGVLIIGLGIPVRSRSILGVPGVSRRTQEDWTELDHEYPEFAHAELEWNLIPLTDLRRHRQPEPKLLRLIARINAQTFQVGVEKLNAARVRVLIAGGPGKRPGLILALGDPDFPFRATCLVTDDVTAREVLDYVREVRHQG